MFILLREGEVRIYSCTLLPTSKVILPNSPLSNIISESACFANFLAKCTQKRKKLCSFSIKKNLGTTCHRTSLTFYETICTSEPKM